MFGRRAGQTAKIPHDRHSIIVGNGNWIAVHGRFHHSGGSPRVADEITCNARGASRIVIACLAVGQGRHLDICSDHSRCHPSRTRRMRNRTCRECDKGSDHHEAGQELHATIAISVQKVLPAILARVSVKCVDSCGGALWTVRGESSCLWSKSRDDHRHDSATLDREALISGLLH